MTGLATSLCSIAVGGCSATAQPVGRSDRSGLMLAAQVAATAGDLAARLESTAERHGRLREVLRPMSERHREHVRAFTPAGDVVRERAGGRVPAAEHAALVDLLGREQRAAAEARAAALRAGSGELAGALASCAACLAQHATVLTAAAAQDGVRKGGQR